MGYINAAFSTIKEDDQLQLGFDKDWCVNIPEEIWIGGEDNGTIELKLQHCLNYSAELSIECASDSDTWDYWRDLQFEVFISRDILVWPAEPNEKPELSHLPDSSLPLDSASIDSWVNNYMKVNVEV